MSALLPRLPPRVEGPRWAAPRAPGVRPDGPGFAPIMFAWDPRRNHSEASDPALFSRGLPLLGSRRSSFASRPRSTPHHGFGSAGPRERGLLWRAPVVLRGRCQLRSPSETQLLPRSLCPQADLQGKEAGRRRFSHGWGGDEWVKLWGFLLSRRSCKGVKAESSLLGRGRGGCVVVDPPGVPRLVLGWEMKGGGRLSHACSRDSLLWDPKSLLWEEGKRGRVVLGGDCS